jgi:hypothetical protein
MTIRDDLETLAHDYADEALFNLEEKIDDYLAEHGEARDNKAAVHCWALENLIGYAQETLKEIRGDKSEKNPKTADMGTVHHYICKLAEDKQIRTLTNIQHNLAEKINRLMCELEFRDLTAAD